MVGRRGSLLVLIGALALPAIASAAYPAPFAVQGGAGLSNLDGSIRYVAQTAGTDTRISAIGAASESPSSVVLRGAYGIATLTQAGLTGGLFHDGSAFVTQSLGLKSTSSFVVIGTKDLVPLLTITLKGTFGFDALSPDGSKLYLIQHTSTQDVQHYIVRAYSLRTHKLMKGRVADKTQGSWLMQGWAVDRVTSADGRWAYTLYANPGGYPFVHALDTVRGVAHCIGVPWRGDQNEPWDMRLVLKDDGRSLAVNQKSGGTFVSIDLSSSKLSYPKGP